MSFPLLVALLQKAILRHPKGILKESAFRSATFELLMHKLSFTICFNTDSDFGLLVWAGGRAALFGDIGDSASVLGSPLQDMPRTSVT